ncbi:ribonuclease H-like domain-containing protein [Rhizophagus clarus]|uniref:Ribonuclease H-like domain-containing protein n=1 Tax=Rhizophagus clarus TaxID=94130 RepID=A0A8H3QRF5_9GLOM|nr:ribonuclease H-like domain-containing protein [Rhizophagus clarus]
MILKFNSTESEIYINLPAIKIDKKNSNKKSGRPFSEVWKTDMIRRESKRNGHYSGTCQYCSSHWKRAKPVSLKIHLTKCNLAPSEVKNYWKKELYGTDEENSTKSDTDTEILDNTNSKRKKDFDKKINKKPCINESYQNDICNHITNNTDELKTSVINIIDKALLNAFICCRIPFEIIENPFFGIIKDITTFI